MRWIPVLCVVLASVAAVCGGCSSRSCAPPAGHAATPQGPLDVGTNQIVAVAAALPAQSNVEQWRIGPGGPDRLILPQHLPGAATPPLQTPRLPLNMPLEEREATLRSAYPTVTQLPPEFAPAQNETGAALTLSDLQQMAHANSPILRKTRADADAAYGAMIQAGLHPNPTIGWVADQWQPGNKPTNNSGQQGAFIEQLIKTCGKLSLSRAVAGYDYLNAVIAYRRAEVDLAAQVRAAYFGILVAQQSMQSHRALAQLADEVYSLQLKAVAAGEAAGFEPLQFYAQAMQARNGLSLAVAAYRKNWRALASALGQPDFQPCELAGRADSPAPLIGLEGLCRQILQNHTDLLTARNTILQAQTNIRLQNKIPIPDVVTGLDVQHDNVSSNDQFSLRIGLPIPVFDKNQGAIRQAYAKLASATEDVQGRQNELLAQIGEAHARYDAARAIAENYRENVLPNLARTYRSVYQNYLKGGDKYNFNDVAVSQQNYAQSLASYLTAIGDQWSAAVDLARIAQLDDLTFSGDCANPPVGQQQ